MSGKKIEIRIDKEGKVHSDLLNFNGEGCSEVSEKIEEALGIAINTEKKPEYEKQQLVDLNQGI